MSRQYTLADGLIIDVCSKKELLRENGKIVNYGFFIDNNDHTLKYCHDTKYIDNDGHTVVTDEVLTCRITRAKILKLLGTLSIEWFRGWKYSDDIQEVL